MALLVCDVSNAIVERIAAAERPAVVANAWVGQSFAVKVGHKRDKTFLFGNILQTRQNYN